MADQNPLHTDPIKNGFSQVQRKAPESVWSGLAHNLSLDDTEQAVAGAFSAESKKAPVSAWQGVKKQLIIDHVWLNISAALDKRKRRFFWLYFSGLAVILVAGISFWKFYPADGSGTDYVAAKFNAAQRNSKIPIHHTAEPVVPFTATNSEIQLNESGETRLIVNTEKKQTDGGFSGAFIPSNTIVDSVAGPDETGLKAVDVLTEHKPVENEFMIKFPPQLVCPIQPAYLFSELPQHIERDVPVFNRFELGLVAGVDNTWIFNNDVRDGLNRFSLVDNKFSMGYHAGASAYVNFSENHGVGLHVDFLSVMNQRYDHFEAGTICTNLVVLRQQKYKLVYRYTLPELFSNTQAFVFKGGIFMALATKSELYEDKELLANQVFERFDGGITAAIGSQHTFGSFVFEYGLQSDAGFTNIATSSSLAAKKFNYTNTYLTGVYCSFRYRF